MAESWLYANDLTAWLPNEPWITLDLLKRYKIDKKIAVCREGGDVIACGAGNCLSQCPHDGT